MDSFEHTDTAPENRDHIVECCRCHGPICDTYRINDPACLAGKHFFHKVCLLDEDLQETTGDYRCLECNRTSQRVISGVVIATVHELEPEPLQTIDLAQVESLVQPISPPAPSSGDESSDSSSDSNTSGVSTYTKSRSRSRSPPVSTVANKITWVPGKRKKRTKGLACEICGKISTTYQQKSRHFHEEHSTKLFACPQCPKTFKRKDVLNKHIKTQH